MIGIFGYGLSLLFFGLATELWMLFVSRALSGVLSSAALTTAMAYIGDSTPGRSRGGGMGLLGAAAGAGAIIGPGIGGVLAGRSLATPFFTGAGLSFLALLLVGLLLPESLPPEARLQPKDREKLGNLGRMRQALAPGSPIRFLLFLAFLATFGTSNFESVFGLYALKKLAYGPEQVGAILTVVGVVALAGRGLLTGWVTRHWGEPAVIKASLLGIAGGFGLLLLARTYPAVLLTTGLLAFTMTFLRPSIHSLTSQRAASGQGAAMGLSNSFVSLGRMVGPLWAGGLFDLYPDLPYLSGIAILLVCFVITIGRLRPVPPETIEAVV
jgi:DHA1 family multidrug resistance protein-like MFS transporter